MMCVMYNMLAVNAVTHVQLHTHKVQFVGVCVERKEREREIISSYKVRAELFSVT